MTPLYDRLKEADIVILASPIFFASVPSQLKAMIDRCQSEWVAKYILRKKTPRRPDAQMSRGKGAFICVSGHNKKTFFENAKKIAEVFFKTMDIDFTDELFFGGVNAPGDIKNIKGALQKAYRLGQRIGKG
jgi:putative NADPH-quinone reductase